MAKTPGDIDLLDPDKVIDPQPRANLTLAPTLAQGPRGLKGDQGPRGYKGDQGSPGPVGPVGAEGPVGPMNTIGGPEGPPGPRGEQGLQGIQGMAGVDGSDGFPLPPYTLTNVTTDRTLDADSTSIGEVADVLGTLITDVQSGAVGGSGGGGYSGPETRAAILTSTIDASVKTFRTAGFAIVGDPGDGRYRRLQSAPSLPANKGFARSLDIVRYDGTTDATHGGWWTLVPDNGVVWAEQFGAKADMAAFNSGAGATDNGPIINAAIAWAGITPTCNTVRIGPGLFYTATPIQLKAKALNLWGSNPGRASQQTFIGVAAGIPGIIINEYRTIDEYGVDAAPSEGDAGGSDVGYLRLFGHWFYTNFADKTPHHGILVKTRCRVHDCWVAQFSGCGIAVMANTPGNNANNWSVEDCSCYWNQQSGLFIYGIDANAGMASRMDCLGNGEFGVWDESFLGNTHIGHHADGNGRIYATYRNPATPPMATHNGMVWIPRLQIAGIGQVDYTHEPGTDPYSWEWFYGDGAIAPSEDAPAWNPSVTYIPGGAYAGNNVNARNVWVGGYAEGGQPPSQYIGKDLVLGGPDGSYSVSGGAKVLDGTWNYLAAERQVRAAGANVVRRFSILEDDNYFKFRRAPGAQEFQFHDEYGDYNNEATWTGNLLFSTHPSSREPIFRITGGGTLRQFGTTAPQVRVFRPERFALGPDGNPDPTEERRLRGSVTFNPDAYQGTPGGFAPGDVYLSFGQPSYLAVRCYTAGDPGKWRKYGRVFEEVQGNLSELTGRHVNQGTIVYKWQAFPSTSPGWVCTTTGIVGSGAGFSPLPAVGPEVIP